MIVLSPEQIDEVYKLCESEYHLKKEMILESIGSHGAYYLAKRIKLEKQSQFICLVGKQMKAAKSVSIARNLQRYGFNTLLVSPFKLDEMDDKTIEQIKTAQSFGIRFYPEIKSDELEELLLRMGQNLIFLDGVAQDNQSYDKNIDELINLTNNYSSYSIAIDYPTGICSKTGAPVGEALKANLTLCFDFPHQGLFLYRAPEYVGRIKNISISLPPQLFDNGTIHWLHPKNINRSLIQRSQFADKAKYGHTLLIGGSHGLTGAVALGSKAALRIGSGVVTAATWEPQYSELVGQILSEVRTGYIPLDEKHWSDLSTNLNDRFDSIVIGPGLAKSSRARKLVLMILESFQGPVVLDADAINVLKLKEDAELFKMRKSPVIMTPHIEELSNFIERDVEEIQKSTIDILKEVNHQINSVILLKGACSFIAYPGNNIFINFFPNAGMATGGVGDVLAGILGGMLAQSDVSKENLEKIVNLSVLVHSLAGDLAAKNEGIRSMSASSLINYFDQAFEKLQTYLK